MFHDLTTLTKKLKRAKYRELNNLGADDVVTDEMLKATTEAQLFPMASQYADEEMEEDSEETTQGTAEDGDVNTSKESGAAEE